MFSVMGKGIESEVLMENKLINGVVLMIDSEYLKCCTDPNCNEINPQPLSNFYNYKRHSKEKGDYIYYHPECKSCTSRRVKERRINNPEYLRKNTESQRKRNSLPEVKLQQKKWRTSEKGILSRRIYRRNHKEEIKGYGEDRLLHKKHKISKNEWENCKNYFNYRCAYCGLAIEEHWIMYNGNIQLGDFHKEHADDNGANDLSNCIPSCKSCNSTKNIYSFDDWYNESNQNYTEERYNKIIKWLDSDYKKYIKVRK